MSENNNTGAHVHQIPSLIENNQTSTPGSFNAPAKKSCANCINAVKYSPPESGGTDKAVTWTCSYFGKQLNSDKIQLQEEVNTALEIHAGNCSKHKSGNSLRLEIGPPDRVSGFDAFFPIIAPGPSEEEARAKEMSSGAFLSDQENCIKCKFFVSGGGTQLGFTGANACAATGKILPNQLRHLENIASSCTSLVRGQPVIDATDLQYTASMLPAYNTLFIEKTLEAASAGDSTDVDAPIPGAFPKDFEPSTYVSDAPVDDYFIQQGVRAWYRLSDPEGTGNSVLVPIFNPEIFNAAERSKIPSTSDDERPGDYVDHQGLIYKIIVSWNELDETPALIGPAGTGKTEVLRTIAWLMQIPFERISITGSTELDELQGKMVFENNETVFKYGRLAAAWMKPNVICLDEPNVGPPEVWQFIRPLTDNSKQLVIDANRGERIIRNQNCFIGLAMNPAWDAKNVGAEFISDADASRLLHIETQLPPRRIEEAIIRNKCSLDNFDIPKILLDTLFKISDDIRAMSDKGELPISWGVRSQIKVARLLKWFPLTRAYDMAGLGSLEPEARQVVMDIISTRAGDVAARARAEKKKDEERERELAKKEEKEKARLEKLAELEKIRREAEEKAREKIQKSKASAKLGSFTQPPPPPPPPPANPPQSSVRNPHGGPSRRESAEQLEQLGSVLDGIVPDLPF